MIGRSTLNPTMKAEEAPEVQLGKIIAEILWCTSISCLFVTHLLLTCWPCQLLSCVFINLSKSSFPNKQESKVGHKFTANLVFFTVQILIFSKFDVSSHYQDKRAHHNALERKRRDHIKESFTGLRDAIPTLAQGDKSSRAQILKKASEYISFMRKKNNNHQR